MEWRLWSNDCFDREAAPSDEATGADFVGGCAILWRKTLDEGVQADGRPTFTGFQLKWDGGSLSLPRDPSMNPELARLKPWVDVKGVIFALAKVLAASPTDQTARRCLKEVAAAADALDLCARLGHPVLPPPPKRRFDFTDSAQLIAFLSSDAPLEATALTFDGPALGLDAIATLAASPKLAKAAFLFIDDVPLGDEGLRLLCQARLPALKTLGVCDSGVTDHGASLLAGASWAQSLRELTLSNRARTQAPRPNVIGDAGARALAASPPLQRLETLDVGFNPLGDAGAQALVAGLPALRELVVWRTAMTQDGATACARLNQGRARHCVVHSDFTPRHIDYSEG